jgi:Entner-Doudoroff aldolase
MDRDDISSATAKLHTIPMLEKATAELPDFLFGLGTVLDAETARAGILAGARFIVTPALRPAVITLCRRYSVPVFAGAFTPTEIVAAWEAGADAVKIFPAEFFGPAYIKSVKAPLPHIELVPTGGVTPDTIGEFLKAGAMAGVVLNRVNGKRHERILRECIEQICGIPVVGAIPKLSVEDLVALVILPHRELHRHLLVFFR